MVVDASAILEVLLRTPASAAIEHRLFSSSSPLSAPHLIDLEVLQVLRRLERARHLSTLRCVQAFGDWGQFPVTRYPHDPLAQRIWQLRAHVGAYDAAYISLAEALDVPILTHDAKMGRMTGHRAKVVVL